MDTLKRVKLTAMDSTTTYFYLWSGRGPLVSYLTKEWKKDSTTPYFKRWASEGPLYASYAMYLIGKYPIEFAQRFLMPNAVKFAVPPTEFLGVYNMGSDSVSNQAKDWFHYKSQKVMAHNKKDGPVRVTDWYPVFATLVNVLLLIHLVGLAVLGGMKNSSGLGKLLILAVALWLVNSGFSILASPIVMRYQFFPVLIGFCVALMAGEAIYKSKALKA